MLSLAFLGVTAVIVAVVGCALIARQMRPGTTFRDCAECPEMVVIPAGTFIIGDSVFGHPHIGSRLARPLPRRKTWLREFREFLAETGYSADRSWQDGFPEQTAALPAVYVSWDDAEAYTKGLSARTRHQYRLLTESEYEFAERAGTTSAYWWGEDARVMCSYANGKECHEDGSIAVGSHRPNAFGLDDMTGNEFEWVEE